MKQLLIALLMAIPALCAQAQTSEYTPKRYLAGAVPTVNGYVTFSQEQKVEGKSKEELFNVLREYIDKRIVNGPDHLQQARITEADATTGIIAASIDEYLYFKRTNWQIHRVHFYYQLIAEAKDGGYTITMRNLHYKYDPDANPGEMDNDYRAENWITDDAALSKNGKKLARVSGKFRKFTIDRKDQIFKGAARAAGVKGITTTMEEEEEE